MARNFKLTWQPGKDGRSGRWKKKYKGRVYYFSGGRGKSDREAYDAAVAAWETLKFKLEAAEPRRYEQEHGRELEHWEKVLAWSSQHGDKEMAALATEKTSAVRKLLAADKLKPLDWINRFESAFRPPTIDWDETLFRPLSEDDAAKIRANFNGTGLKLTQSDRERYMRELDGSPSRIQMEIWRDRLAVQERRATEGDDALEHQIDRFLLHKHNEAASGEVSVGRTNALRIHLKYFQDWLGRRTPVHEITSEMLLKYRLALLERRQERDFGNYSAKHYLDSVKYFIKWLWSVEAIPDLPRILRSRSKDLSISVSPGKVKVFTKDEIATLLSTASERTRLFILLMLNCGMTQKDVADLLVEEVDWEQGRIIRKRSKTRKHASVPEVNYLLWPPTFELLKKHRFNSDSGRVLLNRNGTPLWTESAGQEGKIKKNDNIKNAFDRLARTLKMNKSLKLLKKTSASLLRANERFRGLEGLFLGQTPQSMSDKHYTTVPQHSMDHAIVWLRAELGITSVVDG